MDACLTGSTCLILFSLLVETIALSSLQEKHAREELKGKNPENHFDLPADCGLFGQEVFCFSSLSCNKYCAQKCSYISSLELRNLQILSSHQNRIQESHDGKLLDTNLRINYYDVEMTGAKPALCGDYSTLVLPSYSVRESQSIGTQILHKLYYQNTREVYTHDECNHQCFYGCRPAGYDEIIIDELIERDIPDLLIYQCESVHVWVYISLIIIVFVLLLIFISCYVRSKISSIYETTDEA